MPVILWQNHLLAITFICKIKKKYWLSIGIYRETINIVIKALKSLRNKKSIYLLQKKKKISGDQLTKNLIKSSWLQILPFKTKAISNTSKDSYKN